jgi:hypothetical protein
MGGSGVYRFLIVSTAAAMIAITAIAIAAYVTSAGSPVSSVTSDVTVVVEA